MAACHKPPLLILVVENHCDLLDVIGMYLEVLGHRYTLTSDAAAALAVAKSVSFDAVIVHANLPFKDGWRLLEEMDELGCRPPCSISMSARATGPEKALSIASNCHGHLFKPFTIGELAAHLGGRGRDQI